MFPAFDSGEDAAWIGGPYEGSWIGVGFGDEAVDSVLEVVDGSEDSALEPSACEFGEEALDRIEPGCGRRCEWKVQRGCWASHARTLRCL